MFYFIIFAYTAYTENDTFLKFPIIITLCIMMCMNYYILLIKMVYAGVCSRLKPISKRVTAVSPFFIVVYAGVCRCMKKALKRVNRLLF